MSIGKSKILEKDYRAVGQLLLPLLSDIGHYPNHLLLQRYIIFGRKEPGERKYPHSHFVFISCSIPAFKSCKTSL